MISTTANIAQIHYHCHYPKMEQDSENYLISEVRRDIIENLQAESPDSAFFCISFDNLSNIPGIFAYIRKSLIASFRICQEHLAVRQNGKMYLTINEGFRFISARFNFI